MAEPIISWYESDNNVSNEVSYANYGTTDADSDSIQKTYYIWNNRNGQTDVSKMEEVTYTTRDRNGGVGDSVGNIVEVVRDNWMQVRVDSLNENSFTAVGKDSSKAVGTEGTTINPNASTATVWTSSTHFDKDIYIKPTVSGDFIYKVTKAGTSDATEPTWTQTEGNVVQDGTVEYVAIRIEKTPATQEILGVANSVLEDGSNAEDAGANFIKITNYVDVPITASSGKNLFVQRISYRYV